MADDIRTVLKFVGDAKQAEATIQSLIASLQRAAESSRKLYDDFERPIKPPKIPSVAPQFNEGEKAALAYAQATARLQVAQGNLAGAQSTLSSALKGLAPDTVSVIRAQTQLVGIEAQLSTAAGKAETALLREAQAVARLQQISGNTPAAIKTLGDALAQVGNRTSLPALRAELQKTYLDTNYANSPLISAIDRVNAGLRAFSPLLGGTAGQLSQLVTVSGTVAQAISNSARSIDTGSRSAQSFAQNIATLRSGLRNFLSDQKGEASLSLGFSNAIRGLENANYSAIKSQAASAFNAIRSSSLSAAEGVGRVAIGIGAVGAAATGLLAIGAAGFFASVGGRALEAAKEVDAARQSIAALVGGADAANEKIAELRRLAQESPGVTTGLATTLFSQLRASSDIADASINKVIQSVGKLNAVFTIEDPKQFSRNLIQIFTQGFERADIKEALGRVPIFEQFLEEAFGTKDAGKLRALKESGKLTLESFLTSVSAAINNDARFANVRESLGAQFAKATDNITFALAPIGDEIAKILLPIIGKIQPKIEEASRAIARELADSRDEFELLVDVTGRFIGSLDEIRDSSGITFSLQAELLDIAQIIEFVTGGVKLLQDAVEILLASAKFGIQGVVLAIESGLQGALSLVGIQVQSLDDSIRRLAAGALSAFDRIEQGFKRTREFNNQRRFDPRTGFLNPDKDGVVDFGNALLGPDKKNPPPPPPNRNRGRGGVDSAAKKRQDAAAKAARDAARAELSILQTLEKSQELSTRAATERLKTALEDRLISLEDYTEAAVELDRELLQARLTTIKAEEEAAVRAAKTAREAEAKRAEFKLKADQARLDTDLRTEALRDELRRTQERAEENHQKRLEDIRDIGRRSLADAIEEEIRLNRIGAVDGQQQIIALERQRIADREAALRRELDAAKENLQERQRINDELARLAAEREAFESEASRRIANAQRDEAAAFREFIQDRVASLADLRRAQLDAGAAQIALELQRGLITQRQAQQAELERRRELIRIESLEREQDIERKAEQLRREAEQARLGAAALIQIEVEKNAALKAERERAAAEQQALLEQQRQAQLTPGFGEQAAGAISGVEESLGRQLSLWEQNKIALNSYTEDLETASSDAWERAGNVLGTFTDALGAAVDAFVESGGSIKAAGKVLAQALAAPLIEAAKTEAKFQAAKALAALAVFDIRGAVLHGLAAAGFAALAGLGTALVNGGGSSSASSSSAQSEAGQQIRKDKRTLGQDSFNPVTPGQTPSAQAAQPQIVINLRGDIRNGILDVVHEDINQNGRTRALIQREARSAS